MLIYSYGDDDEHLDPGESLSLHPVHQGETGLKGQSHDINDILIFFYQT